MATGDILIRLAAEDKASDKLRELGRNLGVLSNTADKAGSRMMVLGAAMAGIAAAGAVLTKMVTSTVRLGEEMKAMSMRTGISVETLSKLRFAADQANVSMEQIGVGLRTLARNAHEATRRSSEQARAFHALGVSVRNVRGELRPVEAIMLDAADRLKAMTDMTKRAALAQELFGRSGADLLPLLLEGSKGIELMMDQARALGLEMSTKDAEAADTLGDAWGRLGSALSGLSQAIGIALVPALTVVTGLFTELILGAVRAGKEAAAGIREFIGVSEVMLKRIVAGGKAVFAALWKNVTVLWKLYVVRPVLASWQWLLGNLGGMLGFFGIDVQAQLAGVREALAGIDADSAGLVSIGDAWAEAVAGVPDFKSGMETAQRAVKDFKEEVAPISVTSTEARTGGRFMGLPHTKEWQAKIAHDQRFLNDLTGIYRANWNTMVSDHVTLWDRFAAGVSMGVADYRESLGTFTSAVKQEVERSLGEMERGLSGVIRTLFFGREDEAALGRSRRLLEREARAFGGIQLDVFGEIGPSTQATIQQIQNVFDRVTQGLSPSLTRQAQAVRDRFIGLSDPTATPESVAAARRALEDLIDKIGAQAGFMGRLRSFGDQMRDLIVEQFEVGMSNLLAGAMMRGLTGIIQSALFTSGTNAAGAATAKGVHAGMEYTWRNWLNFDFVGEKLKSVAGMVGGVGSDIADGVWNAMKYVWENWLSFDFLGDKLKALAGTGGSLLNKMGEVGFNLGAGMAQAMDFVWEGTSFDFIANKLEDYADALPSGAGSVGERLGVGIKNGMVVWATGKTFEQLTGINLPDPVIKGLSVAEGVLAAFGTNLANEVAAVFGRGDEDSLIGRIQGSLGGAVRGAFLGAGIGTMFGPTGAIGGAIGGGLAGALTTALQITGPLGGAITAIGGFMASTIFASFAATNVAGKRYTGITGEAVEAFKAGGIGRLESKTLQRQQALYRGAGREGRSSAIRDLSAAIREQLPGLNAGESREMAQAFLIGDYYGARGTRLNELIRRELTRQAAEEQVKMRTMAGIFATAETGPAPSGPLLAQRGLSRVPGSPSTPVPAILHGGEMVLPAQQAERVRSGSLGGGVTVNFYLQSASDREIIAMIRDQLPMIERSVSEGIRKGARFGIQSFDERMIRTTLQS